MKEFKEGEEVLVRGKVVGEKDGDGDIQVEFSQDGGNDSDSAYTEHGKVIPVPEFTTGDKVEVNGAERMYLFTLNGLHYHCDKNNQHSLTAHARGLNCNRNGVRKLPEKKEEKVVLTVGGREVDINDISRESWMKIGGHAND